MFNCGAIDWIEEDCEVTIELVTGKEIELYLTGEQVAHCNGWYYCLIDSIYTLGFIVRELALMGIEIESEDIKRIIFDGYRDLLQTGNSRLFLFTRLSLPVYQTGNTHFRYPSNLCPSNHTNHTNKINIFVQFNY